MPPGSPVSPRPLLSILAGIFAGLVLGVGAVFALRMLDPLIRREDQVRARYRLPILARVPQERGARRIDRWSGATSSAARSRHTGRCGRSSPESLATLPLDPDLEPGPRRGQDDLGDLARGVAGAHRQAGDPDRGGPAQAGDRQGLQPQRQHRHRQRARRRGHPRGMPRHRPDRRGPPRAAARRGVGRSRSRAARASDRASSCSSRRRSWPTSSSSTRRRSRRSSTPCRWPARSTRS